MHESGIEVEIAGYLDKKEYVKAAKLADRSRDNVLRDAICNEGRLYNSELASGKKTRTIKGHMSFVATASAYKEMAVLYGIKEDSENQERYAQLSKEMLTAYIQLSRTKR